MNRIVISLLILMLGLSVSAAEDRGRDTPATPAEQYQVMAEEFFDAKLVFSFKAKTDEERNEAVARVDELRRRFLELALRNPKDPIALDALVQVIHVEFWLENYSADRFDGKESLQVRAIALLLRDHSRSDKLGEACWIVHYGFRRECETFLRTVLKMSPHKDVRAQACLRLAQFLNARSQRLDLIKERPEMLKRYQGLFGKDYLEALQQQDRAKAVEEVETLLQRAAEQYGDVELPRRGRVGEQAESELYEIRHLAIGKEAPDVVGEDQDGKRFKLSDYRGKVVLLYFWDEF